MPYREIYLGDGEYTIARVPDSVVDEWRERREANKNSGYPDRPPDIDTETLRSWVVHPDEPGYVEQLAKLNNTASFIVYTITLPLPDDYVAKLLITYVEESYKFRLKVQSDTTGDVVADNTVKRPEWDNEFFEITLTSFTILFGGFGDPMITTYADVENLNTEMSKAILDLDQYWSEQGEYSGNN